MNIGIIGLGLIGGSFGRAVTKYTDNVVYGADTDADTMLRAKLINACSDELTEDNAKDLDLLVVALNPKATLSVMEKYAPLLKDGATVIDTCGVKRIVINGMQKLAERYPKLNFIGIHPMAGREFSGISHSSAGLFEKAYFIMVNVSVELSATDRVMKLFAAIGSERTVVTTAEEHDRIIAYTSQLAHVVSNAYMRSPTASEYLGFSAGSFRDMTRVARLNPQIWTELFLENADNLVGEVDCLIKNLQEVRNAVASGNAEELQTLLADGTKRKEAAEAARREKQ